MMADKNKNALALYRFLESEWDRLGIRPTAWCRQVRIADATVLRWREGVEPDMRSLRRVAEALERPLIDLLLAAEYVTPEQIDGREITDRSFDLLETIRLDPKLSSAEREALRQVHDAFALVESGAKRKVRVKGSA